MRRRQRQGAQQGEGATPGLQRVVPTLGSGSWAVGGPQAEGALGATAEGRGSQNPGAELGRPGRCQKGVQALRASGEEQASRSGADGLGGPLGSIRHQLLRTPGSVRPRMPVCAVGARSSRRSVSGRCGSCFSCTRLCQLGAERGSSSLTSLPCKTLLLGASRLRALWEVSLVFFTDLIATEKSWPGDTVSWTRAPLSSPRAGF